MEAARTPLLLDVVLVVPRVAVPIPPGAGAPAPAAVAPPSTSSPASDAPARAAAVVLAAGVGRGPHEGEVDLNGLVEQLGLVGAVDGGAGLGERGVFDQCVALLVNTKPVSPRVCYTNKHTDRERLSAGGVRAALSSCRGVCFAKKKVENAPRLTLT